MWKDWLERTLNRRREFRVPEALGIASLAARPSGEAAPVPRADPDEVPEEAGQRAEAQ